jgi:hypothetical protein
MVRAEMDDFQGLLAERACRRLYVTYHVDVDAYRHDAIVALFADDAVWHHNSGALRGHADIAGYLASKSTNPIVLHVVSNVLIDVRDENNAAGVAYVTVFYAEPADPPTLGAPVVLVTYRDTFRRTSAGWCFAPVDPQPLCNPLRSRPRSIRRTTNADC